MTTGSHRRSIVAVAEGSADVAAIDAVCWALARRHDRSTSEGLRVLAETPTGPGLPLITVGGRDAAVREVISEAVADAIADLDGEAADILLIRDLIPLSDDAYEVYVDRARAARAHGYDLMAAEGEGSIVERWSESA